MSYSGIRADGDRLRLVGILRAQERKVAIHQNLHAQARRGVGEEPMSDHWTSRPLTLSPGALDERFLLAANVGTKECGQTGGVARAVEV